jgi:predicted CopG family antitoxin
MPKCITVDDDVYQFLLSLKRPGDSFTKVLRRHVAKPADTCGELLDVLGQMPPPVVDLDVLDRMERERGRRSGGRK